MSWHMTSWHMKSCHMTSCYRCHNIWGHAYGGMTYDVITFDFMTYGIWRHDIYDKTTYIKLTPKIKITSKMRITLKIKTSLTEWPEGRTAVPNHMPAGRFELKQTRQIMLKSLMVLLCLFLLSFLFVLLLWFSLSLLPLMLSITLVNNCPSDTAGGYSWVSACEWVWQAFSCNIQLKMICCWCFEYKKNLPCPSSASGIIPTVKVFSM